MKITASPTKPVTAAINPTLKPNVARCMAELKRLNPALHALINSLPADNVALDGSTFERQGEDKGKAAHLTFRYEQNNTCDVYFYIDTDLLDINIQAEAHRLTPEESAKDLVASFTKALNGRDKRAISSLIRSGELLIPFKALIS